MGRVVSPVAGEAFATGQVLDKPFGLRKTLEAVKDQFKGAKYAGILTRSVASSREALLASIVGDPESWSDPDELAHRGKWQA